MDVELPVVGQVVVDDQGHLRDVQAPGPDVGGDEHPAAAEGDARPSLSHEGSRLGASHPRPGPWLTWGEGQLPTLRKGLGERGDGASAGSEYKLTSPARQAVATPAGR